jgi:hypothetical protein
MRDMHFPASVVVAPFARVVIPTLSGPPCPARLRWDERPHAHVAVEAETSLRSVINFAAAELGDAPKAAWEEPAPENVADAVYLIAFYNDA